MAVATITGLPWITHNSKTYLAEMQAPTAALLLFLKHRKSKWEKEVEEVGKYSLVSLVNTPILCFREENGVFLQIGWRIRDIYGER